MNKSQITLSLYFEIKDSETYGGEDSIGYAAMSAEFEVHVLSNMSVLSYAESQRSAMACVLHVPECNVRIISRSEYEQNTED